MNARLVLSELAGGNRPSHVSTPTSSKRALAIWHSSMAIYLGELSQSSQLTHRGSRSLQDALRTPYSLYRALSLAGHDCMSAPTNVSRIVPEIIGVIAAPLPL